MRHGTAFSVAVAGLVSLALAMGVVTGVAPMALVALMAAEAQMVVIGTAAEVVELNRVVLDNKVPTICLDIDLDPNRAGYNMAQACFFRQRVARTLLARYS